MTQFDNLLRAAFDAGASRAESEAIWTNLDNGVYVGETPDFDEWRASLSGLKVGDDSVIRAGDSVEIVGHDSIVRSCRQFFGRKGIARSAPFGDDYFYIYDPHEGKMVGADNGKPAWPLVSLRKINR